MNDEAEGDATRWSRAWQGLWNAVDAVLLMAIAAHFASPMGIYLIGGPSAAANSSMAGVLFLFAGFFVALLLCAAIFGLFRGLSYGLLPARLGLLLTSLIASDLVPSAAQQDFERELWLLDDAREEVQREAEARPASLGHARQTIENNIPVVRMESLPQGEALNVRDGQGWTPLTQAVRDAVSNRKGDGSIHSFKLNWVRNLLEAGADPNRRRDYGETPLELAQDSLPVLELLARHGADPNLCSYDTAFWRNLGEMPTVDVIRLAAHFRQLGPAVREDGLPCAGPLHVFAAAGRPALVQYFLNRGLDPNEAPGGWTPLHHLANAKGVSRELQEVADLLVAAGADPSLRDAYGQTPEVVAAANPALRAHLQNLRPRATSNVDRAPPVSAP